MFSGNFLSVLPGAYQIMVSDQGVTNGATMIRADQSGNGWDYTQVANQPTTSNTLAGRATLTFGTPSVLSSSLPNHDQTTTPWELACVVKVTTWISGNRILGNSTTDATVLYADPAGTPNLGTYAGTGTGPHSAALAVGSWGLVRAGFTNSTSDFIRCGAGAAVTGTSSGTNPLFNARIGGTAAATTPMEVALVAYGPLGFSSGAPFLAALDAYYGGLVLHP